MNIAEIGKPYVDCTIRTKVWIKCDYCGAEFQRVKKSVAKLNAVIAKDSCGSKECKKKKQIDVNLLLYGAENYFQSEDFDKKSKSTNKKKYGSETYFQSNDFKNKRKDALIAKLGVENPLQSAEVREKQKETCKELYGKDNYAQTEIFKESIKQTNSQRTPEQIEAIQDKKSKTCEKKYGTKSYVQTKEYWKQRKKTCLKKYGVEHPHQSKNIMDKVRKTNLERYGVENYAKTEEFRKRFIATCLERYGVPNPFFLKKSQIYGKTQKQLQDWLNSLGYCFKENYSILSPQEIDLYDENLKIGIEYCGLFWHSELSPQPRLRFYHYDKYIKCLQKGVRLITIYEDEWKKKQEQCKGILQSILGKNDTKIYARKCKVVEINRKDFNDYCLQHHLLGNNNLGLVFYVLTYDGEVVAGMSLGRHHRKNKTLTLDRLCFKGGLQVVGGASKLFKNCKQWASTNGFNQIITWSDNRWSEGNVYKQLGFTLDQELLPDYSYIDMKQPFYRISKQSQKKSNTNCPDNMTEKEWCFTRGLSRIWDCGKKRWVFHI